MVWRDDDKSTRRAIVDSCDFAWRPVRNCRPQPTKPSPLSTTIAARSGRNRSRNPVARALQRGRAEITMNAEQINGLIEAVTPLITTYAMRIVGVLVLLWVAFRIARWLGDRVTRGLEDKEFDGALSRFFGSMTRWGIQLGALLGCLGIFGVETTSFAAVIGAAGLAIGLAFQGTLANFAAGVMLLVFRPFDIGDYIKAGGQEGLVEEIGLFTVTIDTLDNRRIVVPNSGVAGQTIENVTFHKTRRVDLDVGVAYDADVDATRKALELAVSKVAGRLKKKEHQVFLAGLGDSAVNWQVRIWCKTGDFWVVHEQALQSIKENLDGASIGIPFPNLEVHLVGGANASA
jgi:small conductance mechanosensitive channel